MPNRVIKESIKCSPQIDALTWFEEVVFYRLIVTADDYGCFDGRPIVIKNSLFPTKDSVTVKSIESALSHLASVGLIYRYESNGMPYLTFPTWERHQRVRNKHRKYPQPEKNKAEKDLSASRGQLSASCQPESNPIRIQSESNPNPIQSVDFQEDDGLKRVCKAYEDAIGAIPRYVADEAMSFVSKGLETALVCRAIQLAAENNVRKWSYAAAILRDCESKGITTLSAFNANNAAKKKPPERRWKEL